MSGTSMRDPVPNPGFDPGAGMTPAGRIAAMHALAPGWWMLVLRGVVAILFGLILLLYPPAGLGIVLGLLAAWFAIDGVLTITHAIRGHEQHRGWFWFEGIISILAAIVLFLEPVTAAIVLVLTVGIWNLVTGVAEIVAAFRTRSWLLGLAGTASVLVGLFLVAAPGPGLLALLWVVGVQAIVFGALLLVLGFRLRRVSTV